MECHETSNMFPPISTQQFDELVEDIRQHGLLEPIMLLEGKILDGRHRYRACLEAKVEPTFENYVGNDPVGYAICGGDIWTKANAQ